MKRTIAITMAVLILVFCFVGCGRQNNGNVSESNNGTVTESTGKTNDQTGGAQNSSRGTTQDTQNNNGSGIMDDARDMIDDTGDAIGDAGRSIGRAITGNEDSTGTGMTGGR